MKSKDRRCPVCGEALAVVGFKDIEMDLCYPCRGVWLDKGELEQLLDKAPRAGELVKSRKRFSRSVEKPRPCPECGAAMTKSTIGLDTPVVVDHCPAGHGEWFDRGELLSLMAQGGLDLSHLLVQLLERILAESPEEE